MNRSIAYWSTVVALSGFLFGFDTAVISGADLPLQRLWNSSDLFHGLFIMSSALWGTVFGALFGNVPAERYGRKISLIVIGLLYLVSATGSALAQDPYVFSFMRFIGGLGVGASSIVAPAFISEIAPAKHRGRLVVLYQFQLVFGILTAFFSNFALAEYFDLNWRWMLGAEAVPAIAYLLLMRSVPESPRWLLLRKNDEIRARNILAASVANDIDRVVRDIRQSMIESRQDRLLTRAYRFPVLLAFLFAAFNQLSGINFIIYFAPRVFELAGLDTSTALLSTAGIGLINLVTTLLGMYLIDRVGRKRLMLIGSIGYIVSLSTVAWAFGSGAGGMLVVFFVFAFIASHAVGQGAVIWVFIAEIFPNNVRTKGQALGCGTHWVLAALITLLMPSILSTFQPASIFGFFAATMVLQLFFVIFLMPETKGKSLESLGKSLISFQ